MAVKSNNASLSSNVSQAVPADVWTIRTICIPVWVIIIVFGCIGNALTIRVLRSKNLRTSSTTLYLSALALVDLLYLMSSLSTTLVHYIFYFPVDPRTLYPIYCYLSPVSHYTLTYLSVWLLVSVTIDRMIWVVMPFKAKKICTRKKATITTIGLAVGFSLIDCHFFWTLNHVSVNSSSFTKCGLIETAAVVFPYVDLVLMGILPFIIMVIANSFIIYKLRKMKNLREANLGNKSRNEKTSSLTTMLLSINVFFMISISPLLVYDIIFYACNLDSFVDSHEDSLGGIVFGVERLVQTIMYLNFSIHFLLYCMSGPKFREEALKLFGIKTTVAQDNGLLTAPVAPMNIESGSKYELVESNESRRVSEDVKKNCVSAKLESSL